jgi:hypothetical protein
LDIGSLVLDPIGIDPIGAVKKNFEEFTGAASPSTPSPFQNRSRVWNLPLLQPASVMRGEVEIV